jgi:hypothetical protein
MTDTGTAKPKRQSLKDIARRVSTIPPSPDGQTKERPRTPLDSMRPVAVSAPPPPPAERMNELAELCAATADRVRGDKTPQAVEPPRKRKSALASALPILGGIAVGLGAIALSVMVITRTGEGGAVASAAQGVGAQPAEVTNAPAKVNEEAVKAPEAVKSPDSESDSNKGEEDAPAATPPANEEHAAPPKAVAKGPGAKIENKPADKPEEKAESTDPATEPAEEQPKGLAGAMADAVGKGDKTASEDSAKEEAPAPAAGSIPLTPSQGQVQSALAAVRGAARGCVAGMEAPSRASVTFGPNGRVSGVSVSGAASGKPAAACIQSALSSARVPPFTKSSFTVGLSLRP